MHKNGISALVAIFISALTISATKAQSSYTATEAYVKNAVAAEAKRADKAITNAVDAVRQETSEIYLPKAWVVDPVDATSVVGRAADAKATNREINKIADNLSSNYYTKAETDAATNGVLQAANGYTDLATNALGNAINTNITSNYYTKAETDDAIDSLAAYYITADASGNAFASYEALTNATVFYTGGEIRTPTRNDYCVVLSDETHGGSEWRYIYAVGEGETEGQWEAQYPIETNDYDGLSNKPSINGNVLTSNLTGTDIGVLDLEDVVSPDSDAMTSQAADAKATYDALVLKADNVSVVHTTGNETIGGDKTFTNNVTARSLTIGYRKNGTIGNRSLTVGEGVLSSNKATFAMGYGSEATGEYSHAEGNSAKAKGNYSHAEGSNTTADSAYSHAEGYWSITSNSYAHAEGDSTVAIGKSSHAEGVHTIAKNEGEHAEGRWNASHSGNTADNQTLHSIGFGTADNARTNAVETMRDGKTYVYGIGGYDGTNLAGSSDLASVVNGKIGLDDIPDASTTRAGIVQLSNATNSTDETMAATPKALREGLAGKASTADATLTDRGFTEWVCNPAVVLYGNPISPTEMAVAVYKPDGQDVWALSDLGHAAQHSTTYFASQPYDSAATSLTFTISGSYGFITRTVTATREAIQGYTLGSQSDKPLASEAEAESLRTGKADKSDVDPLLFSQYYPDGSVKSSAEFTHGIKYDDPDTTNRTITVKPFSDTRMIDGDNSHLVGRVVIPPFVDAQGNGYISDNGTRFKVVGVSDGVMPPVGGGILTAVIAPNTVKIIGISAFIDCHSLTSISLPSVMDIGDSAFIGCNSLTSISLPSVTNIWEWAFYDCTSLSSVSLPSVTNIWEWAFYDCTSLSSVSLPVATTIGNRAFNNCTSLSSVDFGDTPRSSVPTLGNSAFAGVPTTCKIIVPDAQYDEWIASPNWSTLYANGYQFLRHSEWEYARKYEIAGKVDSMENVSWEDLKLKRDNGELVPGSEYRITNYWATSNGDMSSRAVTNQFDIIVVADATNVLNETARAIRHDGDTYFPAETKFEAWRLQYCINNDTNRFAWAVADADGGRGVIYRMVDEFENDVPYDFKGLQFRRWAITNVTSTKLTPEAVANYITSFVYASNGGKCFAYKNSNIYVNGTVMTVDSSTSAYYYTFDSGNGTDYSLSGGGQRVYGNKMREYLVSGKAKLHSSVFLGNDCYYNTFGNDCYSNTFGAYCYSNTFGDDCYSSTFGDRCYSNTFGDDCYSSTFGNYYYSSTFGNDCSHNTFGDYCSYNTFGNDCSYNTFGDYCFYNTFGNDCYFITFGTSSAPKSYCRYITVESGNQYIYLNPTGTTSYSACYQNVTIKSGVNNTTTYKTITDPNVNQDFNTTYQPKNSQVIEVE